MLPRCLFVIFLSLASSLCADPEFLSLPDSKAILQVPVGWTVHEHYGEIGMYPPEQPEKGPKRRIHLSRFRGDETTLQAAIDADIDRITSRSPAWGSSNDRKSYKGSTPIRTESGMDGLLADFYHEGIRGPYRVIVKYYFLDESGKIFRVCVHGPGDEARFQEYEKIILKGLSFENIP